ncbi:hypothetical protein MRX96_039241 [Rhipicephalus microplus]
MNDVLATTLRAFQQQTRRAEGVRQRDDGHAFTDDPHLAPGVTARSLFRGPKLHHYKGNSRVKRNGGTCHMLRTLHISDSGIQDRILKSAYQVAMQ